MNVLSEIEDHFNAQLEQKGSKSVLLVFMHLNLQNFFEMFYITHQHQFDHRI